MTTSVFRGSNRCITKEFKLATLQRIVHLPANPSGLSHVTLEYATEEDVAAIFHMYRDNLYQQWGLALSDVPTKAGLLAVIRKPHPSHAFVVKAYGNKLIGYFTVKPAVYSCSASPVLNCGLAMLQPQYANRGIARAVLNEIKNISRKLGYVGVVTEAFSCNPAPIVHLYIERLGGQILGRIPYAGKSHNHGWTDTLVIWVSNDRTEKAKL